MRYGLLFVFFFQAEDGIRYLVRSRGLGDVYKRQVEGIDRDDDLNLVAQALDEAGAQRPVDEPAGEDLSLIHI